MMTNDEHSGSSLFFHEESIKLKVMVHQAEEGGYCAEDPLHSCMPCATQDETFDELLDNIHNAVEGCLSVDIQDIPLAANDKVMKITV
ncbi:MAG: type II toxin-antitoxin system HicB family antitoxin [Candidatus Electronema sp. VV]